MPTPVLKTDWTNADLALDDHPDEHNAVAQAVLDLYAAHGDTAATLASVYDAGTDPSDSTVTVNATAEAVIIKDAATPLAGGVFAVSNNAGSSFMLKCTDAGCLANFPWTFTGELASPSAGSLSTKLGTGANALGANSTAVGRVAQATQDDATALGYDAQATGLAGATAIGNAALADGAAATALGQGADAGGAASTALGNTADAGGDSSVAVGNNAGAGGGDSVAVGVNASADVDDATAVGNLATVHGLNSVALGRAATAGTAPADGNDNATAVGYLAGATKLDTTAVGQAATATADHASAFGKGATASGAEGAALGYSATASADSAVALGAGATASAASAMALGDGASATHANAVALGDGAATTQADQVVIGSSSVAEVLVPATNLQASGTITADGNIQAGDGTTGAGLLAKGAGAGIVLESPAFPIISAKNTTETDANGARNSFLVFYGETSAGVNHALAYLTASHSGTGTDHKGRLAFHVNKGAEGSFPSMAAYIDLDGNVVAQGNLYALGELEVGLNAGGSMLTDTSETTAQRTLTMPDEDVHLGDGLVALEFGRNAPPANTTGADLYFANGGLYATIPFDAELIALSASSSQAQTANPAGTVKVEKNGTATGDSVVIANTDQHPYATGLSTSFSAGDRLGIVIDTVLTWAGSSRTSAVAWFRMRHR